MGVRLVSTCHVFSSQPARHHGMVVVLHTSSSELWVEECRGISGDPEVRARLELVVNEVPTVATINLDVACSCEVVVWLNAHSNNNMICLQLSSTQLNSKPVIAVEADSLDPGVGQHVHSLRLNLLCGPV